MTKTIRMLAMDKMRMADDDQLIAVAIEIALSNPSLFVEKFEGLYGIGLDQEIALYSSSEDSFVENLQEEYDQSYDAPYVDPQEDQYSWEEPKDNYKTYDEKLMSYWTPRR